MCLHSKETEPQESCKQYAQSATVSRREGWVWHSALQSSKIITFNDSTQVFGLSRRKSYLPMKTLYLVVPIKQMREYILKGSVHINEK